MSGDLVQAVERMVELAEETLASELPDGEAREKVAALARVGREALAEAHAGVAAIPGGPGANEIRLRSEGYEASL